MIVHYDCKHFLGYKPCAFHRECDECPHYEPFGTRILIIKLAAMGDVLRTTPLLRGLRKACPGCHITWLTEPNVLPMLAGVREIDRLTSYTFENVMQLEQETFDQVYCFDKEPRATALAMKTRAAHKAGFGMSPFGTPMPLNKESEYTFELGINDPLKFRVNNKTYPELIYECAALPYERPVEYVLPDFSGESVEARAYLAAKGIQTDRLTIGLNTGAGDVFATKKWTEEGYVRLADRLVDELDAQVLLLGGPAEAERNSRIRASAAHTIVDSGVHPIRAFAGLVANCDLMVTGDTLALHIAIGLGVPVVVIMGPTCHQEIGVYGRGAKIVSDFECSPCYLSVCPKEITCMDATPADTVFETVARLVREQTTVEGSSSRRRAR